ncbi:hypothetical protein PRIPAC_77411 [Pristionchus pacificus]|uniref:Thiamine diphosphokinase n=1 Tax=Pristionchus pacificus TaxID=54126 RepID=A0A2A6CLZ1_PRIPA|nr:hypothetical protein PRIPAC_77411 [Pristionchus pacificus]|eukprot:PDM79119.1 hypothetical protein PRIPAC_31698 [Pristionchus pacificus]
MGSIVRPLEVFTKESQERITNDTGAIELETRARSMRLKCPTAICGNIHGLSDFTRNFYKEKQCTLLHELGDNRTDLSACLDLLRAANAPSPTVVLGGLSGRADRTLGTLHSLVELQSDSSWSAPPPYVIILDGDNLVCVLRQGSHRFEFDHSHLTGTCGIAPICQSETLVTTDGYRWNLERTPLAFGSNISTSNELISEQVMVNTSAPLILTFELLSGSTNMTDPQQ